MVITMSVLLAGFLALAVLLCLLVLLFLHPQPGWRLWYMVVSLSFAAWVLIIYLKPGWGGLGLLIFPLIWILGILFQSRPLPPRPETFAGEPLVTQEQLRGKAGTREALIIYFTLVLLALLFVWVVFYLSQWLMLTGKV